MYTVKNKIIIYNMFKKRNHIWDKSDEQMKNI